MMRRALGIVIALACVGALSSCSILTSVPNPLHDDSDQKAGVQMQHIADAVKHHDATALEKLFSSRAREKATDLDGGLKYFLSLFPSGKMTWETQGTGLTSDSEGSRQAIELYGGYKVWADGKKYDLYFAYFPVNTLDPDNVGIYALGMAPWTDNAYTASGAKQPFDVWASQFGISNAHTATGDPGVYVPRD